MNQVVSDAEIQRLVSAPKKLAVDPMKILGNLKKRKVKEGHKNKQKKLKVINSTDDVMEIVIRQGKRDPMNFSAILLYHPSGGEPIRLRRYNGRHQHTNFLDGERFCDFHVHMATENYQRAGRDADAYAKPTGRFHDLDGALRCLLEDCQFEGFERRQRELFDLD